MINLALWLALRRYRASLQKVSRVLSHQAGHDALAEEWAERLATWAAESRAIRPSDTDGLIQHLARTRRAFGGMGSLNDVSVTKANIPRQELFESVNALLSELNDT